MPTLPGGESLPSDWRDQPTTQASLNQSVTLISGQYGSQKGAAFRKWYTAAWKKDPKLTPNQAVAAWLTGTAIGGGTAAAGSVAGQVPGAAAKGAETAINNLTSLIPSWALSFGNWTGILTRALKIGFGAILITAGIIKLTNADKTLNQVLPLVGGPVGKVLKV